MRLDLTDPFERGTLTMQMEDIVDTLNLWQTVRLYLFCRQTRSKHRSMFGVDWTRSEAHYSCCGDSRCDGGCNPEPLEEFCGYCGASIPHRDGEGRCPECAHHQYVPHCGCTSYCGVPGCAGPG